MINEVLPEDCLLTIFSYLPISNLWTVGNVCQDWTYYAVKTWARNRKHINMSEIPDHLYSNPEIMKKIAQTCSKNLKSLQLEPRSCYSSFQICKIFAKNCPKIETLKLTDFDSGSDCLLSNFANKSKELKRIELVVFNANDWILGLLFRNNQKLQCVHISTCYITGSCLSSLPTTVELLNLIELPKLKPNYVAKCIKKCNSITTLALYNLKMFRYHKNFLSTLMAIHPLLEELMLGHINISPIYLSNLINLKTLLLMPYVPMTNEILQRICTYCRQLEYLNISYIDEKRNGGITMSGLRYLNRLRKLKHLSLTDVHTRFFEFLPAINDLDLQCLSLKNFKSFEDRDMFSIISRYTNLEILEITSTRVTADAMWFAQTALKQDPHRPLLHIKFHKVNINIADASKFSHPLLKVSKDGIEMQEMIHS